MPLRYIWLALALWGAVHPMYWFISFLAHNGGSMNALIEAWYVNASATGLAWDRIIAAIVLTLWAIAEVSVRRNWPALIAIPVTFCIGVGCGLPLYLYFRSRPIG
ncbi:DUF2834 domain-containing protein [Puniceibacterium sp. IMCC21224]|uniref:DUF2834 domain-containing protein n=1 Tax=Puniceibacterium sp. IMCC21224 TaxID=1618204 RepID=UPI00065D3126|nr:Protein of unknown function (DUF2834) [Puniceibacterium sp. IMCC21224]